MSQAAQVVVVELFTSQGCSSCPPADAVLSQFPHELAGRRILPLAFHVDYWDHLGWRDPFARPAWTARQRRYAEAFGLRAMYTPQAVVHGQADCVGSDERRLRALIEAAIVPADAPTLDLEVSRGERAIDLVAAVRGAREEHLLCVVLFESGGDVHVERGENAGRTLGADHVVRTLEHRPLPTGVSTHHIRIDVVPIGRDAGIASFIQDRRTMAIRAAAVASI
jgi:hypothetical protein